MKLVALLNSLYLIQLLEIVLHEAALPFAALVVVSVVLLYMFTAAHKYLRKSSKSSSTCDLLDTVKDDYKEAP